MDKPHFDRTDYSVVVKNRAPSPNSWKWEIYRAGRSSPLKQSSVGFLSVATAHRAGKEALRQFLDKPWRGRERATMRGAVYAPPMQGLPPIAVIFHENEVIGARAVPSEQEDQAFLATMMQEFAGMVGHKGAAPKQSK